MNITLTHTEHVVRLRFQATPAEVKILTANGVMGLTKRVYSKAGKVTDGGKPYLTAGKRQVPYTVKFGWHDVTLFREEMFLTDCPNYKFLKALRVALDLGCIERPAPVDPTLVVCVRSRRKVHDGKVGKRVLTMEDMLDPEQEREVLDQHRQERLAQEASKPVGVVPVKPTPKKAKKQDKHVPAADYVPASENKLAALLSKFN